MTDFRARRALGIGGSDIGAICGAPAYLTEYGVWLSKIGQLDDEPGPVVEVGNVLEDAVILWAAAQLGYPYEPRPQMQLVHPAHEWSRCHPDYVWDLDGRFEGLEAKVYAYTSPENKALPHELQARWCMAILAAQEVECPRWHLVGLDIPSRAPLHLGILLAQSKTAAERLALVHEHIPRARWVHRVIERDLEVEDAMIRRAGAWWQRHVVDGEPVAADFSTACKRHQASRPDNGEAVLDEDAAGLARAIAAAKARRDAAVGDYDALLAEGRARVGDAHSLMGSWGRLTHSRWEARSLDARRLRAERPELGPLLDLYTTTSPRSRLTTTLED